MKKIIIFTDGGSRGNPGPASLGVVIYNEVGKLLKEYAECLGQKTNNEAEYEALIFALKKTKALFGKAALKDLEVEINSDSELLIKQLNGQYKVMDEKIQPLFLNVWNLKIDFGRVIFRSIPREKNQEADKLANYALDNQSLSQTLF
jgi:ribonuclease HI